MSLSRPCVHTLPDQPDLHRLIGLVGVDLHMEDVAQDITYYSSNQDSYAFIITTQGETHCVDLCLILGQKTCGHDGELSQ